jgi:hypothetical protein
MGIRTTHTIRACNTLRNRFTPSFMDAWMSGTPETQSIVHASGSTGIVSYMRSMPARVVACGLPAEPGPTAWVVLRLGKCQSGRRVARGKKMGTTDLLHKFCSFFLCICPCSRLCTCICMRIVRGRDYVQGWDRWRKHRQIFCRYVHDAGHVNGVGGLYDVNTCHGRKPGKGYLGR